MVAVEVLENARAAPRAPGYAGDAPDLQSPQRGRKIEEY